MIKSFDSRELVEFVQFVAKFSGSLPQTEISKSSGRYQLSLYNAFNSLSYVLRILTSPFTSMMRITGPPAPS
jgi:hypothetical protein